MQFSSWIVTKRKIINWQTNLLRRFKKPSESSEYKAWRGRFLRQRIKLCLWIAFPCNLTYTVHDLYDSDCDWSNSWVEANLASLFFLLTSTIIYRTEWGKNNLKWLFVFTSLGLTCLPDLWMIIRGSPTPSAISLNMVFITQTVFFPFF